MDTIKNGTVIRVFLCTQYENPFIIKSLVWTEDSKMKKDVFTKKQIKELEKNPNILRVTDHFIYYHPDFKVKAVHENLDGKAPTLIFTENGLDLDTIGKDTPRKRIYQWKKIYEESGDWGLQNESRGKTVVKRNIPKELSTEEKLKRAEAKIKFLEAENDFLKKLEELERQAMKKKRN